MARYTPPIYKAIQDTTPFGGVAQGEFFSDAEFAAMLTASGQTAESTIAGGFVARYTPPIYKAIQDTTPFGGVAQGEFFSDAEFAAMLTASGQTAESTIAGGFVARYTPP